MSADSRLGWLLFGCVVGFVLGYIVRSLREVKAKVEEVDARISHETPSKDDGFFRSEIWNKVALLFVVLLVAWASFTSQGASNGVKDNQAQQARVTSCSQRYLAKTIAALNARTKFSQSQANANVALQRAQSEFLSVFLRKPIPTAAIGGEAFQKYFTALNNFIAVSSKTSNAIVTNSYPTNVELANCLKGN